MATVFGVGSAFAPIDPIEAVFRSAVLNGAGAVPIMIAAMLVAARKSATGEFTAAATMIVLQFVHA